MAALYRMLDAAYPPTTEAQAATLRTITGAYAFAVYVPGWGDPYRATQDNEVKALVAAGYKILPILVPNADSVDKVFTESGAAVGLAIARKWLLGLGLDGLDVALDIEAGWSAADGETAAEFVGEFVMAAAAVGQGARLIPYCSPSFANRLATLPDISRPEIVWVASWIGVAADSWPGAVSSIPLVDPTIYTSPGQRGWQFAGGAPVGASINADRSIVGFTGFWEASSSVAPDPAPVVAPTPAPVPTPALAAMLGPVLPAPPAGVPSNVLVTVLNWSGDCLRVMADWYDS